MNKKLMCLIMIFLLATSCKTEEPIMQIACGQSCKDEVLAETIINKQGKIVIVNDVFCITTDSASLNRGGYIVGSENILVPCNLSDDYKVSELKVIISGQKSSCCNLVTLPVLRTSFGCKFEVTSIKKL
ncbi:hypothetical protein [Botryobacter ruber]|uniref:hypothetical protein n=1 Tax=Botryobacter ruber TaxID=2171629 RepID=UPI000F64FD7C|nr:hypothetical protein [Botryobacter ruber]